MIRKLISNTVSSLFTIVFFQFRYQWLPGYRGVHKLVVYLNKYICPVISVTPRLYLYLSTEKFTNNRFAGKGRKVEENAGKGRKVEENANIV